MSGVCELCGCSEFRPCLGGVVFTSSVEARQVHRLVDDEDVLDPGATCHWVDEGETICSAHTMDELATAGLLDGEPLQGVGS